MDKHLIKSLIKGFLAEDIGRGDITSESIFSPDQLGAAKLVAREDFIVAGLSTIAIAVFKAQNKQIEVSLSAKEGRPASTGDTLMTVKGPVLDLLKAERVALNLLQRISGIATFTNRFVKEVAPLPVRIVDTRKTSPGLRIFEKYGVSCGGGMNHRYNLCDGVLIKDNHIAASGSISKAVARVRAKIPHTIKIEVETDTIEQVHQCLECKVDIIMLDNMSPETMREAVSIINGRALVEASGGVSLENVRKIAESGVNIISIGALTHSAPSCDIGMDWLDEA